MYMMFDRGYCCTSQIWDLNISIYYLVLTTDTMVPFCDYASCVSGENPRHWHPDAVAANWTVGTVVDYECHLIVDR